jgi:hypothetical protein
MKNFEESVNSNDDPLLVLSSIWDCPQINKAVVLGPAGIMVAGWICGWCPPGKGAFKGDNATMALACVAKILRNNIRSCDGNIPLEKMLNIGTYI